MIIKHNIKFLILGLSLIIIQGCKTPSITTFDHEVSVLNKKYKQTVIGIAPWYDARQSIRNSIGETFIPLCPFGVKELQYAGGHNTIGISEVLPLLAKYVNKEGQVEKVLLENENYANKKSSRPISSNRYSFIPSKETDYVITPKLLGWSRGEYRFSYGCTFFAFAPWLAGLPYNKKFYTYKYSLTLSDAEGHELINKTYEIDKSAPLTGIFWISWIYGEMRSGEFIYQDLSPALKENMKDFIKELNKNLPSVENKDFYFKLGQKRELRLNNKQGSADVLFSNLYPDNDYKTGEPYIKINGNIHASKGIYSFNIFVNGAKINTKEDVKHTTDIDLSNYPKLKLKRGDNKIEYNIVTNSGLKKIKIFNVCKMSFDNNNSQGYISKGTAQKQYKFSAPKLINKKDRKYATVLDFKVNKSVSAGFDGSTIAVILEEPLSIYYKLVDRMQIAKAMKELKFQYSDMSDKNKIKKFGKMVGAEVIITGSVVQFGDNITIATKAIDVETGEIKQTAKVSTNDVSDIPYLAEVIVGRLFDK